MRTLWVLQTNKQDFIDDCRKFNVYGVSNPNYKELIKIREGDSILLRLRLQHSNFEYGYIGPYLAILRHGSWAHGIEEKAGVWQRVLRRSALGPRWIKPFPWCIFLQPANDFIDDLRVSSTSHSIEACLPIYSPNPEEFLAELIQNEFLPVSRKNAYRTMRGVWVRSRAEHMIDNWFAERGIVTFYEKSIYLDGQKITPDWFIPSLGIYVEYLGLKGNTSYDKTWELKEQAYKKHKIEYVSLVDGDLENLDQSIPQKIPQLQVGGILR